MGNLKILLLAFVLTSVSVTYGFKKEERKLGETEIDNQPVDSKIKLFDENQKRNAHLKKKILKLSNYNLNNDNKRKKSSIMQINQDDDSCISTCPTNQCYDTNKICTNLSLNYLRKRNNFEH